MAYLRFFALMMTCAIPYCIGSYLWHDDSPKVTTLGFIALALLFLVMCLCSLLNGSMMLQTPEEERSKDTEDYPVLFLISIIGAIVCAIFIILLFTTSSPFRTTVDSTERVYLVVGGAVGEQLPPGYHRIKWSGRGRFWSRKEKDPTPYVELMPVPGQENLRFLLMVEPNELTLQEEYNSRALEKTAVNLKNFQLYVSIVPWSQAAKYALWQCEDFSRQGIEAAIRRWVEVNGDDTYPYSNAFTISVPWVVNWDDHGVIEVSQAQTF